jgi:deferrochelatase/peroxidase EfeB
LPIADCQLPICWTWLVKLAVGNWQLEMTMIEVDYNDVQGLVRFGFGKMDDACFYLVRINDLSAARSWLANAHITSARTLIPPPQTALQVAFTADGLRKLQVPEEAINGFAPEFVAGMTEDSRSRRLGDVGENAPAKWRWGRPDRNPHLAIMMYGQKASMAQCEAEFKGPSWDAAFEVLERLETSDLGEVEPFGFVDGISQPSIDWEGKRKIKGDQLVYSNLLSLGEFLLGYSNEYNEYTDRPLLNPNSKGATDLLPALDQPQKRDLGRNGTYLVMRQLVQDVRGFWQFADKTAGSNPELRKRLAEKMVGRGINGSPLLPLQQQPIDGVGPEEKDIGYNQFLYDTDPVGASCPLGSHIRRSNPRNADFPNKVKGPISHLLQTLGFGRKGLRDDLMSPTRFHRLLRRGREYGPLLTEEMAVQPAPPNESESGLHFICINSNIARQFEFVQGAWLISTKFDGMSEESDPLMGDREPVAGCPSPDTYSIPSESGLRERCSGLRQFVTVRGGAYFFLPSLRALRYFASVGA